jgi:hypothetical protein
MRRFIVQFIYATLQALGVCCAFPTETITPAKQFFGPIICAYTSGTLGRVIAAKVKIGNKWHEITGGNINRIVEMFQKEERIELDLTLDEIGDIDAATIRGKQAAFTMKQQASTDPTKMDILTISKVVIEVTDIDMKSKDDISTMTVHVIGYQDNLATALYTFDNATASA